MNLDIVALHPILMGCLFFYPCVHLYGLLMVHYKNLDNIRIEMGSLKGTNFRNFTHLEDIKYIFFNQWYSQLQKNIFDHLFRI